MWWEKKSDDLHGDARWATDQELEEAGMLTNRGGCILGVTERSEKWIYHNGEGSVFTHAPAGFGKTTGLVLPTIYNYREGSLVVTDPKAALTAQTAKHRRAMGDDIVIINPWRRDIEEDLGVDLGDTGFNPLGHLKADSRTLRQDAVTVAEMLCPKKPDAKEPVWTDTARSILTGCILYLALTNDPECSLPVLRTLVRSTRAQWEALADKMASCGHPFVDEYAAEIRDNLQSEKQWAGVVMHLQSITDIYAFDDDLGEHTRRNEFNPRTLKQRRTTVYIVIPAKRRRANRDWLSLVLGLIAESVGTGPAFPVLMIAEEFANLGYMPTIRSAMAEYREAGLKVHLIVQEMEDLKQLYGRDGAASLINHCRVKQYFGVSDVSLARDLEAVLGTKTVEATSTSRSRLESLVDPTQLSDSTSQVPQPLMRAQDILKMPGQEQIILVTGPIPPIAALIKPFFHDPGMVDAFDPNPYRPDTGQGSATPFEKPQGLQTEKHARSKMDVGATAGAALLAILLIGMLLSGALLVPVLIGGIWWVFIRWLREKGRPIPFSNLSQPTLLALLLSAIVLGSIWPENIAAVVALLGAGIPFVYMLRYRWRQWRGEEPL